MFLPACHGSLCTFPGRKKETRRHVVVVVLEALERIWPPATSQEDRCSRESMLAALDFYMDVQEASHAWLKYEYTVDPVIVRDLPMSAHFWCNIWEEIRILSRLQLILLFSFISKKYESEIIFPVSALLEATTRSCPMWLDVGHRAVFIVWCWSRFLPNIFSLWPTRL